MPVETTASLGSPSVAGNPSVGISNFVTFLKRTETYRRGLRRAKYGDERDPAMRTMLESSWPLKVIHCLGKRIFSDSPATSMQRPLCPHPSTMCTSCFAPYCSSMYFAKAKARASRVPPCAMAAQLPSKP